MTFDVQKTLTVGAEVSGDLHGPWDDARRAALRSLLNRHRLLVFRDQALTHPEQIAMMEAIGPVLHAPDGVGFISTDKTKGGLGTGELAFHADLVFTSHPFWAICLQAVDVIDGATSTRFADAVRAYRQLPDALRQRIDSVDVLSAMPVDMGGDQLEHDVPPGMPQHTWPAVIEHPRSGDRLLFVNQQHAAHAVGLPRSESAALLREVFTYLYAEDNVYEHIWHRGDLVLWDNYALHHARGNLQSRGPRTLQRVVVAPKSFFDLCPQIDMTDPEYQRWIKSSNPAADRHLIERVVARGSGLR